MPGFDASLSFFDGTYTSTKGVATFPNCLVYLVLNRKTRMKKKLHLYINFYSFKKTNKQINVGDFEGEGVLISL